MSRMSLRHSALRRREFLGRKQLVEQVVSDIGRPGSNLLLVGAGGVGKTSLAVHSLEKLCSQTPGLQVMAFAATEATRRTPLAVFDSVFSEENHLDTQRPERVGEYIIQSCLDHLAGLEGRAGAKAGRLIIHIDDVPLLDQMSEAVLEYLLSRTDVRVILTCRSIPGPSGTLVRAWRDGTLRRIDVPELSLSETGEFAANILPDRAFAVETVEKLHQMTGGNALFLHELLRVLKTSEQLQMRQGLWVWAGELPAGTSLADILRVEIEQLSAEQRAAFEIVALCAPVPLDLLGRQVSLDALETLAESGLIRLSNNSANLGRIVSLTHPIFGEAMEGLLSPAQCRNHYLALYTAAMARYAQQAPQGVAPARPQAAVPQASGSQAAQYVWTGDISELLTVVGWALDAGTEVPMWLLAEAFGYGRMLTDYAFRIRTATLILRHAGAPATLRAQAFISRIEAQRFSNNPEAVSADAQRAQNTVVYLPDGEQRNALAADLATVLADAYVLQQGRWEDALKVLDWAEELLSSSKLPVQAAKIRLRASRGIHLSYGGNMLESARVQSETHKATRSTPHFLPLASTSIISLGQRGEAKQARALARTQMTHAVRSMSKYPLAAGEIIGAWCLSDMLTGNVREASFIYGLMNTAISRNPGHVQIRKTLVAFGQGLLASMNGEWPAAAQNLTLACAELEDFSGTGSEGMLLATLALAHAANGNHVASAQVRQQLLNRTTGESRLLELPSRYALLLAAMYAPNGGEEAEALALIELAGTFDFALMELRALHLLACCAGGGLTPEQLDRARGLARGMDAPLAAPLLASCEHIVAGGVPSRGDAARLLARRGLFVPATPLQILTPREQQLAFLLALGYSNSQITKKLVISKRTAETHAVKIYQKLNIKSRDDIAEALDELEATSR
ncbi:LuxR C-terminal-related transcriptional regulator [Arthrobacter sp. lap29]|uniref:LuxR C-terminal-related transcriptional regulator n=1 Tax=Arthrobacter sp. lap29 TaxID=3056122 RepID=UPI0028F7232C|nr:LuxR C-terminal-related transcriptional regulator [Arthrobacter sp. lap29]